jgi:hypothetical protein
VIGVKIVIYVDEIGVFQNNKGKRANKMIMAMVTRSNGLN